jgi:hypothetical protein
VVITAMQTSGDLYRKLYLYPAGGGPSEAWGYDKIDHILQQSGLYTILVQDDNLVDSGDYNISLTKIPADLRPGLYNPSPPNGGNANSYGSFQWELKGATATGYDLYFGENVISPLEKIAENLTTPSYPFPSMEKGKVYYWYVVAHTSGGDIRGPCWWFVGKKPPVGDITAALTLLLVENPCDNIIPLSLGVPYTGTTVGGTTIWNNYNLSSWMETGPEKVHKVTTTSAGRIEAILSDHTADLDVFILTSCSNNSCMAFGDEAAVYSNAPSGSYYIIVDGHQGASGAYTLTVYFTSKENINR